MDIEKEKIISELFGVKNIQYISRPALLKMCIYLKHIIDSLIIELFISDPYHPYFESYNEMQLAPMRLERIKRLDKKTIEKK